MSCPVRDPGDERPADWDPLDETVLADQRAAFDALRERCPVARSDAFGWSVLRHAEVRRVLHDPATFSSAVSQHLSVPNGIDPPRHAAWRAMIEPWFADDRLAPFRPRCRALADRLAGALAGRPDADLMDAFAGPFAAEAQCAFLGWPSDQAGPLREWTRANHQAIRDGDRERLGELARAFERRVTAILDARRGCAAETDATCRLMHERVEGRAIRDEELVSLLRNWTVGEVGTIAAAAGIVVHYLATHPELQQRLRAEPGLRPAAIDEILRLDGPLVANRRVTTRATELGGRRLEAGERVTLMWIPANRDPAVFERPDECRPDRDPGDNLLYGAGIHVCPGAPLARLELAVALEALFEASAWIEPAPDEGAERAAWPAAGFERVPVRVVAP